MLPTYRKYNDFVPEYLHGRPPNVIIHCLDQRSNSKKFCDDDILTRNTTSGVFTLQSSSKVHTIDFGITTGKPSCTCADWVKWHLLCKHFFAIFQLVDGWGWGTLQNVYKCSPYLSDDSSAIQEFSGSRAPDCGSGGTDGANCTDEAVLATDELPAKNVFYCVKYTFTET